MRGGWVFVDIRVVQPYVMNWDRRKSIFVFKSSVLVLYCIVPQQYCLENKAKICCQLYKSTYNKGYHSENTADEGGSAEKSQECRRYPRPTVLLEREADQGFVICVVELSLMEGIYSVNRGIM